MSRYPLDLETDREAPEVQAIRNSNRMRKGLLMDELSAFSLALRVFVRVRSERGKNHWRLCPRLRVPAEAISVGWVVSLVGRSARRAGGLWWSASRLRHAKEGNTTYDSLFTPRTNRCAARMHSINPAVGGAFASRQLRL
jgi:hypothetical protein